jgi:hypothetical protein
VDSFNLWRWSAMALGAKGVFWLVAARPVGDTRAGGAGVGRVRQLRY